MTFNTFNSILEELCLRLYPDFDIQIGYGKTYEDFLKSKTAKPNTLFCSYQGCSPFIITEDNVVDLFEHQIFIFLHKQQALLDIVFNAQEQIKALPKFIYNDINVAICDNGGVIETVNGIELFTHSISILL